MAGWHPPRAWWPSLILVTAVPVWGFLNGWNGGQGEHRQPVSLTKLDGKAFRLWRQDNGEGHFRWCAEPLDHGILSGQLAFSWRDRTDAAEFDAGLYCTAAKQMDPEPPRLQWRKSQQQMFDSEPQLGEWQDFSQLGP
jgi:hypothetical protein